MITNSNERMSVGGGFLSVEEFYGLSTDTKPTNTANGSTFFEMDTGKMYRFNYSGATWTETTHYGSDGFGPAPSGGGGGSGGGVLRVNFAVDYTDPDNPTVTGDKTPLEVVTAFESGTYFYGYIASTVGDDGWVLTPGICALSDGYASVQMYGGTVGIVNYDNDSWSISFF